MTMATIAGTAVDLDEDGYFTHPDQWRPEMAAEIAVEQGIGGLTEQHWQVIDFVRQSYLDDGRPPSCSVICRHVGLTSKQVYHLFPARSSLKLVAKIAGAPEPIAYIGGCGVNWLSPWR